MDSGIALLPNRVHVGDSHNILLDLKLSENVVQGASNVVESCAGGKYLEADLQAAGLKVDGDKRLRICATSPIPTTTWNCSFPTSGTQTINLLLSINNVPNDTRQVIFIYKHKIWIDDFLSVSWKPILALMTPILVGLTTATVQVVARQMMI